MCYNIDMSIILTSILAVFLSLLGPLLTIFDLPGNTMMMAARVLFAIYDERFFDLKAIGIAAAIYVAGESWEFFVSLFGIKKEKVSWGAVFLIALGGFIGACIGTGMFPILGSFLGGLVGAAVAAFLYEYQRTRSSANARSLAWKAAKVRFLAMSGKLTAAFCLSYMLASAILKHINMPDMNLPFF